MTNDEMLRATGNDDCLTTQRVACLTTKCIAAPMWAAVEILTLRAKLERVEAINKQSEDNSVMFQDHIEKLLADTSEKGTP